MKNRRIIKYMRENFTEVAHTTLNPEGPGVIRIHLIPPQIVNDVVGASVAIINGQDIVPVNYSWSILLNEFIREVNKYNGVEVSDDDVSDILKNTALGVRKVFPLISRKKINADIFTIMDTFTNIALGKEVTEDIGLMSLGDYAPFMKAPHRMDVMVSAMTKDGKWHCNQKCVHCYAAGQKNAEEAELDTDRWIEILDKLREAGIPQVTFTGGEPTMRDDLFELIKHARWFVSRLNTNGIKLTEEYCKGLREAELDSLQITFYSDNRETHNTLVGAPHYDDTVCGIRNALAAGLNVSINTPLCTLNKDYVSTLKFLHEMGVLYVTCSGLITTGNALNDSSERLQLSREEIKNILKEAVEYCFENGMEISFTSPGWIDNEFFTELGISTPSCGACLSNMAVTPSGNVVPCQSWLSGNVLGNMLTDSWDSIWDSDACRERRQFSAKMMGECPLRKTKSEV